MLTVTAVLAIVTQIMAAAPTLLRAVQAVQDLENLIKSGQASDENIKKLLDELNTNTATIDAQAAADAQAMENPPAPGG